MSVSVKEPPPFDKVTVLPTLEIVCNSFVVLPSTSLVKYPLLATKLSTCVSVSCVSSSPSDKPVGILFNDANSPSKSSEAFLSQALKIAALASTPKGLDGIPSPTKVKSVSTTWEPHWSPPDPVGKVTVFPFVILNWFPETDKLCNSLVVLPSVSEVK